MRWKTWSLTVWKYRASINPKSFLAIVHFFINKDSYFKRRDINLLNIRQ